MKYKSLFLTIVAIGMLLQADRIFCMWDTPVLPPGISKGMYMPPRLPEKTPREISTRRIGGADIWCESIGTGNPVIVIHGGPGLSHDYLTPTMELLARNHQVVFYDQRGCGQSGGIDEPLDITVERYVNDVEGIRKAYGFSKPTIIGHSWGGFIAMNYAIAYPDNVHKLVLLNSLPSTPKGVTAFINEYIRRTAPLQDKLTCLELSPEFLMGDPAVTEEYYKTIFQTYMYDSKKVNDLNLKTTTTAAFNGKRVQEIFEPTMMSPPDLTDDLKKLRIPTLILHGDVDPIPAYTAEETAKSIPGSKFILIQNCGHFPYVERPEIFFETVGNFIK